MMSALLYFSAYMLKLLHTEFLGLVTYILNPSNLLVMGLVTFVPNLFSSKHINMGSSFKDLDATSPTVKTDRKLDKQFEL